ncbi:MAG: ABC transporter ATP-binding protein [Dehalococcoidia bacterium]|nr:ABC transporter ATP-binding protein [Dehalococcoidia bacterium]
MSLIETIDLHQRFGTREVLRGVSLAVEKGEILAIIGPTGSGKTTLLRLLDQLEQPASGKVVFDGQEITRRLRTQVRRQISMVLQKPVVFDATVFDNVAYPLRVRRYDRKAIRERVHSMLKTVGLDGYEKRNARTLSGGETQKVALARALVTDPRLLLLDEPTANLDPASLNSIEDLILRFNRDKGMTIVIATHEMPQGQRLAHRIGVMMNGELIQVGTPADIFYAPSDVSVARFVGVDNILRGTVVSNEGGLAQIRFDDLCLEAVTDRSAGDKVYVFVRPEEITISLQVPSSSARNAFTGEVASISLSGPLARVEVNCGVRLVSLVTRRSVEELGLRVGQQVHAFFKATAIHVISRAGFAEAQAPVTMADSSATPAEPTLFRPADDPRVRWWSG